MVILRSAQEASLFQPVARGATIPGYFGFCLWIAESWTNQLLSARQRLGTSRHTGLSGSWNPVRDDAALLAQPHASPRKSERQSFGQESFFLGILRSHASRRNIRSLFSLALSLCAALSRVRGPTIQPLTPVLGQIQGTKSTSPPWRTSRYRYVGSVAWHPSESEKPRTQAPNAQLPPQTCSQLLPSQAFLSLVPGSRALVPPSRFMPLCQESSRGHFMGPSRVDRCLRHGMGSSHGWRTTPALRWNSG